MSLQIPPGYILVHKNEQYQKEYSNSSSSFIILAILGLIIFFGFVWVFMRFDSMNDISDNNFRPSRTRFLKICKFDADDGDSIKFTFKNQTIILTYNADDECGHDLSVESFSFNKEDRQINIRSANISTLSNGTRVIIKNGSKTYSIIVKDREQSDDVENLFYFEYVDKF